MLSRNQSTQITAIGTLLFKSSNSIESSIKELRHESAQESLGIDSEDNILNYNTKDDTLFIETEKRYYFVKYVFDSNEGIKREDKDVIPYHLDLTPFTATNILYNETERAYYMLCTKGDDNNIYFWLLKYDCIKKDLFIVYDPTTDVVPESYYYFDKELKSVKTINDFIANSIGKLNSTPNKQENFIHDIENIDWDSFVFSFSFNNKLNKFLMTYVLTDDESTPVIYEHKFKIVSNKFIQESLVSNSYSLSEEEDETDTITTNLTLSLQEQGEKMHIGDLQLSDIIENPEVFLIVFDRNEASNYKTFKVQNNIKTNIISLDVPLVEWQSFIDTADKNYVPTIYDLQFFIKDVNGKVIGNSNTSKLLSFIPEGISYSVEISSKEQMVKSLKGNYDIYENTFADSVTLTLTTYDDEERPLFIEVFDITDQCTIDTHIVDSEGIEYTKSTYVREEEYERTSTITECSIFNVDAQSESSCISFEHPKTISDDIPFIYSFPPNENYYTIQFNSAYPLQFQVPDVLNDKVTIDGKKRNKIEVKYLSEDDAESTKRLNFSYFYDTNDVYIPLTDFPYETEMRLTKPIFGDISVQPEYDTTNSKHYSITASVSVDKGSFTEGTIYYNIKEKGKNSIPLEATVENGKVRFTKDDMSYNTDYVIQFTLKGEWKGFPFNFASNTSEYTTSLNIDKSFDYNISYTYTHSKKIYGNISDVKLHYKNTTAFVSKQKQYNKN